VSHLSSNQKKKGRKDRPMQKKTWTEDRQQCLCQKWRRMSRDLSEGRNVESGIADERDEKLRKMKHNGRKTGARPGGHEVDGKKGDGGDRGGGWIGKKGREDAPRSTRNIH